MRDLSSEDLVVYATGPETFYSNGQSHGAGVNALKGSPLDSSLLPPEIAAAIGSNDGGKAAKKRAGAALTSTYGSVPEILRSSTQDSFPTAAMYRFLTQNSMTAEGAMPASPAGMHPGKLAAGRGSNLMTSPSSVSDEVCAGLMEIIHNIFELFAASHDIGSLRTPGLV
jgi:hypothetical protein